MSETSERRGVPPDGCPRRGHGRSGLAVATAILLTLAMPGWTGARTPLHCRGQEAPGPRVTLVSDAEPGEPLVVNGVALAPDGETPLEGATIYVFHTDDAGYYSAGGMDEEHPRLCGVMRTGPDGRYEFRTIRPGAYATGGPRPHIHYRVRPLGREEHNYLLQFARPGQDEDRPTWSTVRPLARGDDGILRCTRDIRTR